MKRGSTLKRDIFCYLDHRQQLDKMDYNKMLSAIFEEAIVGIIVVNRKGIIVHHNPYLNTLFKYEEGELLGKKLEILIPKNYKKGHVHHREKYLKAPRPRAMGTHQDLYGLKKDGTTFPVSISLSYTTIDEEIMAIGYVTDDTEEKNILVELINSKSRLDQAQTLAHIGNFEIDWNTKNVVWSKEMYNIFGLLQNDESLRFDQLIEEFVHPEDKQRVINKTIEIIENKRGDEIEFRITSKDKKLKYLYGRREVKVDKTGRVIKLLGILQDVTKLKQTENELNQKINQIQKVEVELLKLNEALEIKVEERTSELEETVNRLLKTNNTLEKREQQLQVALDKEKELNELKSRFVSMASHEFRTPLSTILSSASLVSRYVTEEQNEKRVKHINRIKSSVNNLTGILNDFLSLSKIEEGKEVMVPEELHLEELCMLVIDETKGLLKEGQSIEHISDETIIIHSDKRILKNILFNLLSNAIKYSSSNSPIKLKIKQKSDYVELDVVDFGIGIPEADQKYLFSRFFRASNVENIQGTGLGLNIVKRYVELLGGKIKFKSRESEGTTISFTIPLNHEKDISNRG